MAEKLRNFNSISRKNYPFFVKTTLEAIIRDKAIQWRLFPSGRQKRMNKRISDAVVAIALH